MKESLHGLEMRDVASQIIGEIVGVIRWHISLGDERVDVEVCDGTVEVGNEGGIVHAASHSLYCYCVALLCAQRFQPLRVRHPRPCQSPEGPLSRWCRHSRMPSPHSTVSQGNPCGLSVVHRMDRIFKRPFLCGAISQDWESCQFPLAYIGSLSHPAASKR